jgi:hypothetical protein
VMWGMLSSQCLLLFSSCPLCVFWCWYPFMSWWFTLLLEFALILFWVYSFLESFVM